MVKSKKQVPVVYELRNVKNWIFTLNSFILCKPIPHFHFLSHFRNLRTLASPASQSVPMGPAASTLPPRGRPPACARSVSREPGARRHWIRVSTSPVPAMGSVWRGRAGFPPAFVCPDIPVCRYDRSIVSIEF